jgi:hypothetical protein
MAFLYRILRPYPHTESLPLTANQSLTITQALLPTMKYGLALMALVAAF